MADEVQKITRAEYERMYGNADTSGGMSPDLYASIVKRGQQNELLSNQTEKEIDRQADYKVKALGAASKIKLLDDLTFGMGNEIAAGGAAGIDKLKGLFGGTDNRSLGEMYKSRNAQTQGLLNDYESQFPVRSLVSSLALGIKNPIQLAGLLGKGAKFAGTPAKVMQTMKKLEPITEAALQGGAYGYGRAAEGEGLEGAAKGSLLSGGLAGVIKGGAAGISKLAGTKTAQNLADNLELGGYGVTKSAIRKAAGTTPETIEGINTENAMKAAFKNLRQQGAFDKGIKPKDIREVIADQSSKLGGDRSKIIQEVDKKLAQQNKYIRPTFDNAKRLIQGLDETEKRDARIYFDTFQKQLNSVNTKQQNLSFWEKQKEGFAKAVSEAYENPDKKNSIQTKIKKAMADDMRDFVNKSADDIGGIKTSGKISKINKQLRDRALVRPVMKEAQLEEDAAKPIMNALKGMATTGGAGVLGLSIGGPVGALLGAGLGSYFRNPKSSRDAASALRYLPSLSRKTDPILSPLAKSAAILSSRSQPTNLGTITPNGVPDVSEETMDYPVDKAPSAYVQPSSADSRMQIDDSLINAVIATESAGKPNAVSPVGAQGLMQLMPETGAELAAKAGVEYNPFDPEQNKQLGAMYLQELTDRYQDPSLALYAYNWGMGNLDRLIAKAGTRDPQELFPYLPAETQGHYQRVLQNLG